MSTPTIELVWTSSGPALAAARRALRDALVRAKAVPAWDEWKAADPCLPRRLRSRDPGPRLHVNGRLAWESGRGWDDPAALARAIDVLAVAARPPRAVDPLRRRMRYVLLPAAGLALLPKCPFCWMAYAGTTAALGLTPLTAHRSVRLALIAVMLVAAAAVVWRAIRIGRTGMLGPVLAGAALVIAGHDPARAPGITAVGLLVIGAAAVWTAWPTPHGRHF
jgi:hypothetical protein